MKKLLYTVLFTSCTLCASEIYTVTFSWQDISYITGRSTTYSVSGSMSLPGYVSSTGFVDYAVPDGSRFPGVNSYVSGMRLGEVNGGVIADLLVRDMYSGQVSGGGFGVPVLSGASLRSEGTWSAHTLNIAGTETLTIVDPPDADPAGAPEPQSCGMMALACAVGLLFRRRITSAVRR